MSKAPTEIIIIIFLSEEPGGVVIYTLRFIVYIRFASIQAHVSVCGKGQTNVQRTACIQYYSYKY